MKNYDDEKRGSIQNREMAKQLVDFSELKYGRITPTDIDGLLEWREKNVIVFMEFKYEDAELPVGQKMALEEIVKCLRKTGKKAYALVCSHHVGDPDMDINAGAALVREYLSWKWHILKQEVTVKEFIDHLWNRVNGDDRK